MTHILHEEGPEFLAFAIPKVEMTHSHTLHLPSRSIHIFHKATSITHRRGINLRDSGKASGRARSVKRKRRLGRLVGVKHCLIAVHTLLKCSIPMPPAPLPLPPPIPIYRRSSVYSLTHFIDSLTMTVTELKNWRKKLILNVLKRPKTLPCFSMYSSSTASVPPSFKHSRCGRVFSPATATISARVISKYLPYQTVHCGKLATEGCHFLQAPFFQLTMHICSHLILVFS